MKGDGDDVAFWMRQGDLGLTVMLIVLSWA
jgi:hypothetical protein